MTVDTEAGDYRYEVSARDERLAGAKALRLHQAPNMPAAWGVKEVEEVR